MRRKHHIAVVFFVLFFFLSFCFFNTVKNFSLEIWRIQVLDDTHCMATCVPTKPMGHKHKLVQFLAKIVVSLSLSKY